MSTLLVSKVNGGALQVLVAAQLAKFDVTAEVTANGAPLRVLFARANFRNPPPRPLAALPLGADVALNTPEGTLYGSAAASQYICSKPGKGGVSLVADTLAVDEWVQWSTSTAAPAVEGLTAAAAAGATFPLDAAAANAGQASFDEAASAMSLYVRGPAWRADSCHAPRTQHRPPPAQAATAGSTGGKKPASVDSKAVAAYSAAVAAVQAADAGVASNAAGQWLVGPALSLADIAVVSTLFPILSGGDSGYGLLPPTVGISLRTLAATLAAHSAFSAALGQWQDLSSAPAATGAGGAAGAGGEAVSAASLDFSHSCLSLVRDLFTSALHSAVPGCKGDVPEAAVAHNTITAKLPHHFQCNAAMPVFGRYKKTPGVLPEGVKSPQQLAQAILAALPPNDLIASCTVTGPGFINITMTPAFFTAYLRWVSTKGLVPPPTTPKHVVVDYSSPNIAKDMHVGHLRSTILGDSLSRVLEFLGHRVTRVNHVGDWGTQFGMLIAHLKDTFPDAATTPPPITDRTTFYKAAKVRFDKEPEFAERAHGEVVALQGGDPENLAMWKALCAVSESMFTDVYKRLGVHPDLKVVGESFYNPMLKPLVQQLQSAGVAEPHNGAVVVFAEGHEVPLMLQKSDGGFGYDSTDLAALKHRVQELKADWILYCVDAGQNLHFQVVFAGARKAGLYDPATHRVEHVGFGVVQGEDKKRLKTRSGATVRLVDLLDEAKRRMEESLTERLAAGTSPIEAADIPRLAEVLGYGGVKYGDLKNNRINDYQFSYDRMLAADGNTAVYLNYAHARMCSILRKLPAKAGFDVDAFLAGLKADSAEEVLGRLTVEHPSECALLHTMSAAVEAILNVQAELNPHYICSATYDIAVVFSKFFRDCRVMDTQADGSMVVHPHRVALVYASALMVRTMLNLVGIDVVDRL